MIRVRLYEPDGVPSSHTSLMPTKCSSSTKVYKFPAAHPEYPLDSDDRQQNPQNPITFSSPVPLFSSNAGHLNRGLAGLGSEYRAMRWTEVINASDNCWPWGASGFIVLLQLGAGHRPESRDARTGIVQFSIRRDSKTWSKRNDVMQGYSKEVIAAFLRLSY